VRALRVKPAQPCVSECFTSAFTYLTHPRSETEIGLSRAEARRKSGPGIGGLVWNTTIVYFILMGIIGSVGIAEKRYRFHSALPVTPIN